VTENGTERRRNVGRTVAVVSVAFLALVALQLWWQRTEREGSERPPEVTVAPTEIEGENQRVEIGMGEPGTQQERERVRRRELKRALDVLASSEDVRERRSAALRVRYIVDRSAEPVLLRGLKDPDGLVAQRCADALVALWQRSESPRASVFFQEALKAYQGGDHERAKELFETCARLDPSIADLYRLRAEIELEAGHPEEARRQCARALRLKPQHFLALCVMARCLMQLRDGEGALQNVESALNVYPGFEEARKLRDEILSLQKAGEL